MRGCGGLTAELGATPLSLSPSLTHSLTHVYKRTESEPV